MRKTDQVARRFFSVTVSYPIWVISVFVLVAIVLGWQSRHFQIEASADTLLTKDNEHYIRTLAVNQRFSPQEFLIIAYEPQRHGLFSRVTFNDIRGLTEKIRELERVESVRSILNVPLFGLAESGLSDDQDPSQWTIESQDYAPSKAKEEFSGHPIYEGLLVDKKHTVTAIQVLFKPNKKLDELNRKIAGLKLKSLDGELEQSEKEEISNLQAKADPIEGWLQAKRNDEIDRLRRTISDYEDGANVYLGGVHVISSQLMKMIKHDIVVFGAAIFSLVSIMLLLLFRSLKWMFSVISCCAVSVISTIGVFSILGLKTTIISSSFIALQIILTLAIVMHLIVQYRESLQSDEGDHKSVLVDALVQKWSPSFFGAVTTSIGFGSLMWSGLQPVIDFGWMMVIAMVFSTAVSLVLFPAIMALTDESQTDDRRRLSGLIVRGFALAARRYSVILLGGFGVMLAGSLYGIPRVDVENSFIDYFHESTQAYKEMTFIDRNLGGSTPLDLVYSVFSAKQDKDIVMTAETVQTLQRIQKALEEREAVGKVLSVVNFTEVAKEANQGKPLTEYELTAVYWMMEDALRKDLLGSFFDEDSQQVRFSVRVQDSTPGLNRSELIKDIDKDMSEIGIPPDRYMLTNLFVIYQDVLQQLYRSQMITMFAVYAALLATFYAIFRSVKVALIGVTPNIMATVMVLGLMGWLAIPLDIMTITVIAIAMGIAVDDTIHYVHRYFKELNAAGSADDAIGRVHTSVGYAIVYTSLVVVVGFSSLVFSNFMPSLLFGILTAMAMTGSLIFNMTVLPALLRFFVRAA